MHKQTVARGVATQLFQAEKALDEAIMAFTRLTTTALEAKGELNLSATLGGDVIARSAALQGQLAAARAEAGALHGAFAGLAKRIRVTAADDNDWMTEIGVGDKHDDPKEARAEATPLRAVGGGRAG